MNHTPTPTQKYTVKLQPGTVTPQWGVYCDGVLFAGGFSTVDAAEIAADDAAHPDHDNNEYFDSIGL